MKIKLSDISEDELIGLSYAVHLYFRERFLAYVSVNIVQTITKHCISDGINKLLSDIHETVESINTDSIVFSFDYFNKSISYVKKEGDDIFISDDVSEFDYDIIMPVSEDNCRYICKNDVKLSKDSINWLSCSWFPRYIQIACMNYNISIPSYNVPIVMSVILRVLLELKKGTESTIYNLVTKIIEN